MNDKSLMNLTDKLWIICGIALIIFISYISIDACTTTKIDNTRNLAYEHYCDSIWNVDPDYYLDVLQESDEYLDYINEHGKWWE